MRRRFGSLPAVLLAVHIAGASDFPANYVAGTLVQLNDNGAWSWFMDERAIVHDGKLIVGSVRAVGDFPANADPDWATSRSPCTDIASGAVQKTVLHRPFEQDDHDGPALMALPDGRYFAMYTKHGVERRTRAPRSCGCAEPTRSTAGKWTTAVVTTILKPSPRT